MSRLHIPASIDESPAASRPLLEAVERRFGVVPNLFRLVGVSPAALEGYLGLSAALSKGRVTPAMAERIALAVAELNGCSYCLSAHTYLGKRLQLDDTEIEANRRGRSRDDAADAVVQFAAKVARTRGRVNAADLQELRSAGYDDAAIIEIILHVALNVWTNYVNLAADTDIDFPVVAARNAA